MAYPKWKYHRDFEPMLVKTEEQEKKLGPEWKDSPAAFGIETHPATAQEELDPTIPRAKKAKK